MVSPPNPQSTATGSSAFAKRPLSRSQPVPPTSTETGINLNAETAKPETNTSNHSHSNQEVIFHGENVSRGTSGRTDGWTPLAPDPKDKTRAIKLEIDPRKGPLLKDGVLIDPKDRNSTKERSTDIFPEEHFELDEDAPGGQTHRAAFKTTSPFADIETYDRPKPSDSSTAIAKAHIAQQKAEISFPDKNKAKLVSKAEYLKRLDQGKSVYGYKLARGTVLSDKEHPLDLSNKNLDGSILDGVIIENAKLDDSSMRYTSLDNASLKGSSGADFDLSYAQAQDLDLSNVILKKPIFAKAILPKINLSNAALFLPGFEEAKIARANLSNAYVYAAQFFGADLHNAKLDGFAAPESSFTKANLRLSHASKEPVYLAGANLSQSSLLGVRWQVDFNNLPPMDKLKQLHNKLIQEFIKANKNLDAVNIRSLAEEHAANKIFELYNTGANNITSFQIKNEQASLKGADLRSARLTGPMNFVDLREIKVNKQTRLSPELSGSIFGGADLRQLDLDKLEPKLDLNNITIQVDGDTELPSKLQKNSLEGKAVNYIDLLSDYKDQ